MKLLSDLSILVIPLNPLGCESYRPLEKGDFKYSELQRHKRKMNNPAAETAGYVKLPLP